MALNLVILFVIFGFLLWNFRFRKSGFVFIVFGTILYVSIASNFLPGYLLYRFQAPYSSTMQSPIKDNTAFLIFGMGTQTVDQIDQKTVEPLLFSYGPILAAVRANHQCVQAALKCTFIASGADVAGTGASEAAIIARELEKAGVNPSDIVIDEKSRNTWQNAKNTAAILKDIKPSQTVLLQGAPIIKRDLLYLAHFGVYPEPVAAAYLTTTHTNMISSALSFLAVDIVLHEEIGIWRYAFYNFMGWNEPKQIAN
ncbi:YdcF family protein [Ochrobactrum sp. Marseille-Q0166]|uniref:YdcF family protein n=1 Tax=Ochrobactrum sp. Marseille-Q0166 TaxID=2761105 RepID=UPI0016567E7B|nr:YdcF family protein [Ochrobactrum sp. Marseille-Q0166]MBC8716133.1 YdcF family protein [Ochrobactrum sp. Marseille-Q0166]